jgi:hypothetical protein
MGLDAVFCVFIVFFLFPRNYDAQGFYFSLMTPHIILYKNNITCSFLRSYMHSIYFRYNI